MDINTISSGGGREVAHVSKCKNDLKKKITSTYCKMYVGTIQ
jgi:hypothetical protein